MFSGADQREVAGVLVIGAVGLLDLGPMVLLIPGAVRMARPGAGLAGGAVVAEPNCESGVLGPRGCRDGRPRPYLVRWGMMTGFLDRLRQRAASKHFSTAPTGPACTGAA